MTAFPTATLFEAAGQWGALPSAIKPVAAGWRLDGPAFPVQSPPADNLWLHRAIYAAAPGDVLVVHVGDHHEAGYWGEIMSTAAQVRGLGGLVIDGCVRDQADLALVGFPVFARGLCIRGTGKDRDARGTLGAPVTIGGVTVARGDRIVGDADGVVVLREERVAAILDRAAARAAKEATVIERLKGGETTLDIYDLA
ncbi:MAG: RraA family protein [Alphaproteobacteria bacterium]|jgi:4-hydroxy-4-methyl-2-oxoglutarate aldolase|nr:RraA family protein [Alphaproteobacteria bacterium]